LLLVGKWNRRLAPEKVSKEKWKRTLSVRRRFNATKQGKVEPTLGVGESKQGKVEASAERSASL
jgi:hypothetical protein